MPFDDIEDGRALAQAIVDTVREPLLVLDADLRVVAASRSFYLTFRVNRQETQGYARSWRRSRLSTASWKTTKSSTSFPPSVCASCF